MSMQWNDTTKQVSSTLNAQTANPWFTVAMGLLGIIVGFTVGQGYNGGSTFGGAAAAIPTPTAQGDAAAPQAPQDVAASLVPIDKNNDHILGNPNAKVGMIVYTDFECPFCQRHHATVQEIAKAYPDNLMIVYRHFPLSFHQNAQKEAEASECVADLGGNDKFWNFTDLLFERTQAGGTGFALDKLPALAKEVGVDEAKFKDCLDTGKYADKVKQQMAEGTTSGVSGTPGNIVLHIPSGENKLVSGAYPIDTFKAVIDEYLAK